MQTTDQSLKLYTGLMRICCICSFRRIVICLTLSISPVIDLPSLLNHIFLMFTGSHSHRICRFTGSLLRRPMNLRTNLNLIKLIAWKQQYCIDPQLL